MEQTSAGGAISHPKGDGGGSALPSFHSPQDILAHPCFPAARSAWVRAMCGLYEGKPFLTRLLVEAGRSVVFFNLLVLDAACVPDDRATWLTIGVLQDVVGHYGVTSTRRVHDLVRRLVQTGYVRSERSPTDGRLRLLRPSDKMRAHHRDWLAAFYRPLQLMFPDPGYGPALTSDASFQEAWLVAGKDMLGYSAQLMAENTVMTFFMAREAGSAILIKLFEQAGELPEGAGQSVSFAELGEAFGVSRTHVRLLLSDAAQLGYLELSNHRVTLLPAVVAAFDRFLADCSAGNDLMFRLALQTTVGSTGRHAL